MVAHPVLHQAHIQLHVYDPEGLVIEPVQEHCPQVPQFSVEVVLQVVLQVRAALLGPLHGVVDASFQVPQPIVQSVLRHHCIPPTSPDSTATTTKPSSSSSKATVIAVAASSAELIVQTILQNVKVLRG